MSERGSLGGMGQAPRGVTIRPLSGLGELDLFRSLTYTLDEELLEDLGSGRRRPEWMWVALRGGRLVARAAWWGSPVDEAPSVLDFLDIARDPDRIEVGVALLRAALAELVPVGVTPPEYVRFIPPYWRDDASSRKAVDDRMAIAAATGARLLVERLRFDWHPGTPIAAPSTRLAFRAADDDAELIELMAQVMDGTLDAHSRADLEQMPAEEAALRHFQDELARYTIPRGWWRLATLPGGEPVGFVIPARNDYNAIVAYIGVAPSHRGHGYVDDILAEGTRILAAEDVPRIRASTDLANIPMAQAFARAGWDNFERAISTTWD
jgi:RimJ/RimL family protein N-acetyltransferase